MDRRHVLTLLAAAAAGCSSQPTEPTSTPDPTQTSTETATDTATASPTETATDTATASPTDGAGSGSDIDAVVATLNGVYADLEPTLETLEVADLDTDALTSRLETARRNIERLREGGTADAERLQSLSDTRWIFDRLVRALARFDEAYDIHTELNAAYRASETTDETTNRLDRFATLADEAASSSGTAVARYDSMNSFDSALDADYATFEDQIFRVGDTANALTPFVRGLETAIPARERYQQAVESYADGAYRDAQNTFIDLVNTFSDARDWFDRADGIAGPLADPYEQYHCDARAARIACSDYRAACREQLDNDSGRAERRRMQAEQRYSECS